MVRSRPDVRTQRCPRGTPPHAETSLTHRQLLYTDGIPEADNRNGEYLATGPMLNIAKENLDLSAEDLQLRNLQELSDFVGDAPQSDDITLMILARDRSD